MEQTRERKHWKEVARDLQHNLLDTFGEYEWDSYKYNERKWIERKVGHAMFGPPTIIPESGNSNQTGYDDDQFKNIELVCETIIREDIHNDSSTWMSLIFVCMEIPNNVNSDLCVAPVPVFRVPKYRSSFNKSVAFIDSHARVYKDWNDYLQNNKLPECNYCYPKDGIYQSDENGDVLIQFGSSPASTDMQKTLTALDRTGSVAGLAATGVIVTSLFFPVAGPLLAASLWTGSAVGVYGAARSTNTLVDRKQHNQSIGVEDPEARNCWLSIVGNAVGLASTQAVNSVRTLAQTGHVISNTGLIAATALTFSSLAINGIGVVNGAFLLHEKYNNNTLTSLDVFQFTSSVLLFSHAAVNVQTADTIIRNTQNDVLKTYEGSLRSNRHRKMFRRVAENTKRNMDGIEGNAKVIRSLMHIVNPDDFYTGLLHIEKQVRNTNRNVKVTEQSFAKLNEAITIDPMKFSAIDKSQRNDVLKATKDLSEGVLSKRQFRKVMRPIYRKHQIHIDIQRNENMMNELRSDTEMAISSRGENVLQKVPVYELTMILINFHIGLHEHLIKIAIKISELMERSTANKFLNILKYVCNSVEDTALELKRKYEQDLKEAKSREGAHFCQERFDKEYNITGKLYDHFCYVVIDSYISNPGLIELLKEGYELGESYLCDTNADSEMQSCSENKEWDHKKFSSHKPLVKHRQFWVKDEFQPLLWNEISEIVLEVTGLSITKENSILDYDGADLTVFVGDNETDVEHVIIKCDFTEDIITAIATS